MRSSPSRMLAATQQDVLEVDGLAVALDVLVAVVELGDLVGVADLDLAPRRTREAGIVSG